MTTLGIDFGTSNTAAAVLRDGRPHVLELEEGEQVMPTAVFLDYARRETLFGRAAARAMIDGREGRFMRALKSILGTPLARERRQFMNERLTLVEVLGRFLAHVKTRAEAAAGTTFDSAVSGRPVHFHSQAPDRDAAALEDLAQAYRLAGFASVRFRAEPEAAALAAGGAGLGLIVDIGGGTSDFTLFQGGDGIDIRASHGVRIGGTDFDRALSLAHAMPPLGLGGALGREFGPGTTPVPVAPYRDLASWEKIAFAYTPEFRREAARMERLAPDPRPFARLGEVLDMHLGHDIAYAVEEAKISANLGGAGRIALDVVEPRLSASLAPSDLAAGLGAFTAAIHAAAAETLARADCPPEAVERVVFVGGSSLMQTVRGAIGALLPAARQETASVFTAVADGLAIDAAR